MKVELIYGHEALLPAEIPDGPCVACLSDEPGSKADFITMCARCARPLHVECAIAISPAPWAAAMHRIHVLEETDQVEGFAMAVRRVPVVTEGRAAADAARFLGSN